MQTRSFRDEVMARLEGLSLAEAAAQLGISVTYMSNMRTGLRNETRLSRRVAARALQLWPSLTDAYLRDVLTGDSDRPSTTPTEPQAVA